MSAQPLRHYFVASKHDLAGACWHGNGTPAGPCGRAASDPVHLTPGDTAEYHDAIRAASPHAEPRRTPEQDAAAVARAKTRNAKRAARYAFGTLRRDPGDEAG